MNFLPSALRPHSRDHVHDLEKNGTLGNTSPYPIGPNPLSHRATVLEPEAMSQLNTFRHMARRVVVFSQTARTITSISMDEQRQMLELYSSISNEQRRPTDPHIQYNRVCHREAQAKRGYKFATVFINGCLGVQIVVAAALTAMGAANSNHVGITAFGAINTVIAGILTYLKGSGLPNRIRYYENEWKRVREYIEQRERDFSRQGCNLNLNEVVSTIEAMYEQVKADIQSNTPDNYISVGDIRARATATMSHVATPNAGKCSDRQQGAVGKGPG
ncbi:hypothetical protein DE146DRAFT_762654 [Phaeosphaeria sp. MPI-PUGE-AT-0046c]|nr:hypothetical protein DE146DRAFT_762654 [Phaeosphaeria sp. MPI-PUGE-AT-0046c]